MSFPLQDKTIVLGVCGSIAAYKSADITSQLVKLGADVWVVMSESATRFIGPQTLMTLSRNPVGIDMWEEGKGWQPGHIDLADRADLMVVAPASANKLAQFAHGFAPDLLSAIYLATPAPVIIAPAMNGKMLMHPATQKNLKILIERGHEIIEPVEGVLACGYEGKGKLAFVDDIVKSICSFFTD